MKPWKSYWVFFTITINRNIRFGSEKFTNTLLKIKKSCFCTMMFDLTQVLASKKSDDFIYWIGCVVLDTDAFWIVLSNGRAYKSNGFVQTATSPWLIYNENGTCLYWTQPLNRFTGTCEMTPESSIQEIRVFLFFNRSLNKYFDC